MGNLQKSLFVYYSNDLKQSQNVCVHVNDSGFLHLAEIQFISVPDQPVSAACFLCHI